MKEKFIIEHLNDSICWHQLTEPFDDLETAKEVFRKMQDENPTRLFRLVSEKIERTVLFYD
jgi:hypothetical protein